MSSSVRSPLRSSSALVATVVPIFTASMPPARDRRAGREPEQVADAVHRRIAIGSGFSDSSLWVTSVPSGRRPITSVKVPPRSIQNSQLPEHALDPVFVFYATLGGNESARLPTKTTN